MGQIKEKHFHINLDADLDNYFCTHNQNVSVQVNRPPVIDEFALPPLKSLVSQVTNDKQMYFHFRVRMIILSSIIEFNVPY